MAIENQDIALEVAGLNKAFSGKQVLAGVDLRIPRGTIFTVLGPSGAGKSVLLKCIANILPADHGQIRFYGQVINDGDSPARSNFRKRCSFLFQNNALFDSLTALENVALPLEQTTELKTNEIFKRSREALKQLEMEEFLNQYPGQLSGGMQKRLALARAIVTNPAIVLFDEPTAGLDPLRRNAVFTMIAKYQRQFQFTALVVTHDVPEALAASDCVALLHQGQIGFYGTPSEFASSTDPVVSQFRDSVKALEDTLASIRHGKMNI